MKRNNIPLIVMLLAGAITCTINLIQNVSVLGQMASLLVVLIVFYFLGCVLKWTLDHFDKQNAEKARAEKQDEDEVEEPVEEAEEK